MSAYASVYGCVWVMMSAACQTPGGSGTRGTDSLLDDTDKNAGPDFAFAIWNAHNLVRQFWGKLLKLLPPGCHILRLKCTKFYFSSFSVQIALVSCTVTSLHTVLSLLTVFCLLSPVTSSKCCCCNARLFSVNHALTLCCCFCPVTHQVT